MNAQQWSVKPAWQGRFLPIGAARLSSSFRSYGAKLRQKTKLGITKRAMTILATEEEHIATLVHADEYARNASQVATISTHKLVFIKRKELAMKPFELVEYPMGECTSISYEVKWAVFGMVVGTLLVLLILFIFASEVPAGTRFPVGALAIALVFGAMLMRGPKRHRITFNMAGKKLKWQSKAGDFKYKVASVNKVLAFAESRGLLTNQK
jgi:hypothetical protein